MALSEVNDAWLVGRWPSNKKGSNWSLALCFKQAKYRQQLTIGTRKCSTIDSDQRLYVGHLTRICWMEVEQDVEQVNNGTPRDRSMNSGKLEKLRVLDDTLQETVHNSGLCIDANHRSFWCISGLTFKETAFSRAATNSRAGTFDNWFRTTTPANVSTRWGLIPDAIRTTDAKMTKSTTESQSWMQKRFTYPILQ